jgi:hypothetical protein
MFRMRRHDLNLTLQADIEVFRWQECMRRGSMALEAGRRPKIEQ